MQQRIVLDWMVENIKLDKIKNDIIKLRELEEQ